MTELMSSPKSTPDGSRTRALATKACDACRQRKVRCQYGDSPSPTSTSGRASGSPSDSRKCRRCEKMAIQCTFLLPTQVRGPRKRTHREGSLSQSSNRPINLPHDFSTLNHATSPGLRDAYTVSPIGGIAIDSPSVVSEESSQIIIAPGFGSERPAPRQLPFSQVGETLLYATDQLCDRELLRTILDDYVELLYPVIPVVHRPTFRQDLDAARDTYDVTFRALLFALSAVTVAIMPRKFREYCSSFPPLRFQTRTEMVLRAYELITALRSHQYFDEINHLKWAISYLISLAFFQVGLPNLCRMTEIEAMQIARLLELHKISSYKTLPKIEGQLRKKAFWLMFYGSVHHLLQSVRKERLWFLDSSMIKKIDFEALLPNESEEEQSGNQDSPVAAGYLTLTKGFNIHSRVFWAALTSLSAPERAKEPCGCLREDAPHVSMVHLQNRLQELRYMLDNVPRQLRPWVAADDGGLGEHLDAKERAIMKSQVETIRANIHVTHLWLQSIILDELDASITRRPVQHSSPMSAGTPSSAWHDPKMAWAEREDICRQLLHVLHSTPQINLETNGLHLAYKVRDVAVSLLACPFAPDSESGQRATQYLEDLTQKLSGLDWSEALNSLSLQSWVDTERAPEAVSPELGLTF